jgi:hypothetical protein
MHELIPLAAARLQARVHSMLPPLEGSVLQWLHGFCRGRALSDYFTPDWGFPLFQLPGILERRLVKRPCESFRNDLVYSTLNGYLFIRLIDDIMDKEQRAALPLLPLCAFFHHEFELSYRCHFPHAHPFWPVFEAAWYECQANTIRTAGFEEIDELQFETVAAQRTIAAKIPLLALGWWYGEPGQATDFCQLVVDFGPFVQMADDLFDWPQDVNAGVSSYFISEYHRQRQPEENLVQWCKRNGVAWATGVCLRWLQTLEANATVWASPELDALIRFRRSVFLARVDELTGRLRQLDEPCFDARPTK